MIGKTIAHYEIIAKLGEGGMGDVYRARDTKLGREVAIKFLPPEFSKDEARRKRFEREAQVIAALKHPNIVTIHSVEEHEGVPFLTMEYVEGKTLAESIPAGGLGLDRFFEITIPLADAIGRAHEQGITHRDLKPANIMFDSHGTLKVLDFGLAKLFTAGSGPEMERTVMPESVTGVGVILGTAAYMSPEQAEGKEIDHRSDIFSLGIVMYEMATGERPFKGDTQISTITSVLRDTPRHISEVKRDMPRHLGRIVNGCLEKNIDTRLQSAKDVRNELIALKKEIDSGELSVEMESSPVLASAATASSAAAPAAASGKKNWLPWTVVGVVVIAAVVFMALNNGSNGGTNSGTAAPTVSLAGSFEEKKMAVVLPFENLGDPEDAYFAAGMTDEITSRLSAVSGIGVISRGSATNYDRSGKTMRQIGDDLGVDYVLEGTVRWAKGAGGNDRVRITPQLIRVSDDTQIWSETYDSEIDDVFEVQTDIATQMIEALDVQLTDPERQLMAEAPTENVDAYKLYLRARELEDLDFLNSYEEIANLYTRAVELDPTFVLAQARLCQHHMGLYANDLDRSSDRLASARRALRVAEKMDPDHAETRIARGSYYYYGFRDYNQALVEFVAATEAAPNNARARLQVGNIHRRLGNWDEAVENQKAASLLDPQRSNNLFQLASTYRGLRRFEEAIEAYEKGLRVEKSTFIFFTKWAVAESHLAWNGDHAYAARIFAEKPTEAELPTFSVVAYQYDILTRDFTSAARHAKDMLAPVPGFLAIRSFCIATAEWAGSGGKKGHELLEESRQELESALDEEPENTTVRGGLAFNLALLGEKEAAVREAKLLAEEARKDKFFGPATLESLARIYALNNQPDEAIDLLETLLVTTYGNSITIPLLRLHPDWDNLRDNPRFKALLDPPS